MLKPIDIQLKFAKDKNFLSLSNISSKAELLFSKTVCKNTQLKKNKIKYPGAIKIKTAKFGKRVY